MSVSHAPLNFSMSQEHPCTLGSASAFDKPQDLPHRRSSGLLQGHRERQLEGRVKYAGLWKDRGLIFISQMRSYRPLHVGKRYFAPLPEKAGLPAVGFPTSGTLATLLLPKNLNSKNVLSEMLRHATITLGICSHVLVDAQEVAAMKYVFS